MLGGLDAVALVGPTASGKSSVAIEVASALGDVEIISVDSMSVYRHMDIGTAKPTPEQRSGVVHHMIDVAEPTEEYSVASYQAQAARAVGEIAARGHRAIIVGGTGLYLRALLDGIEMPGRWPEVAARLEEEVSRSGPEALHRRLAELDPLGASRMEPSNTRRVLRALEVTLGSGRPFSSFGPGLTAYPPSPVPMIGVGPAREETDAAICRRIDAQMEQGWLEEVSELVGGGRRLSRTASQALGYKELISHLQGSCSLSEAVEETKRRTKAFARRQRAWFRRDPRIAWAPTRKEAAQEIARCLRGGEGRRVGK